MNKPFWWPDLPGLFAFALLTLLAIIVLVLLLLDLKVSEQAWALLTTISGVLIAKVGTIADFYFGNSRSSKEKDDTISKMATK